MAMRKFSIKAAEQAGDEHRQSKHLGRHLLKIPEPSRASGRQPDFPGQETARLNVFLPVDLVRKIKATAMTEGKTISQLVAEWAATL